MAPVPQEHQQCLSAVSPTPNCPCFPPPQPHTDPHVFSTIAYVGAVLKLEREHTLENFTEIAQVEGIVFDCGRVLNGRYSGSWLVWAAWCALCGVDRATQFRATLRNCQHDFSANMLRVARQQAIANLRYPCS